MSETQYKTIIARLLEDAKRVQQIEPNAGTAARILEATLVLSSRQIVTGNHQSLQTS